MTLSRPIFLLTQKELEISGVSHSPPRLMIKRGGGAVKALQFVQFLCWVSLAVVPLDLEWGFELLSTGSLLNLGVAMCNLWVQFIKHPRGGLHTVYAPYKTFSIDNYPVMVYIDISVQLSRC